MKQNQAKKLDPGTAVFNSHLNNAKERAIAEFKRLKSERRFDEKIKPYIDAGIMSIFQTEPGPDEKFFVFLITRFVNENRV